VIVSRQALIDSRFSTVICAPVFSHGEGLSTQVAVGPDEGLKYSSWIMGDNLVSLRKSDLTHMWARFPEPNLRNSTTPSRWLLILGRGDYPDPRLATASINLIQLPTRTRPNPTRRFRRSHRSRSAFRACTLPLS